MRRIFWLIGLTSLLFVIPAFAQESNIAITWPPPDIGLKGIIQVQGTINPPGMQSYFLAVADFNADPAVVQWTPISLPDTRPVYDGVIFDWDTTVLPNGDYRLRVYVLLTTGEHIYTEVGPIRIDNQAVVPGSETATPFPTNTPQPTPVPHPTIVNTLPLSVGGQVDALEDSAANFMASAGMTWMKWQIRYVVGDTSLLNVAEDRIAWAHQKGFDVLLSINGVVDELRNLGDSYDPQYAAFLGQIAALHPDAIEVWNEMNLDREWPTGRIDPAAYVEMLRQAYTAIKAVDPQVMVITGAPSPTGAEGAFGVARVWNDDHYYYGMAAAGAANYADCIGVHYNEGILAPQQLGGDPRDEYPTRYFPSMTQRAAYPFRNTPLPLCFTELGYLSPEGYGALPAGFAWAGSTSVQEQATWLRDAISIGAQTSSARIALIIIFNINFKRFDQDPQAGYAIIRPDGTCPACDAIATLRTGS